MSKGYNLLEGGSEFGGRMAEPDLRAIELAGGLDAPICIIPAAAAPDHNHQRAGQNGLRWFKSLGATQVSLLPLIDTASANQAPIAASLRKARLIYLLGGFPEHLGRTLAGSLSWEAMLEAFHAGAVVGGSSAGAMVLCQHYYDPYTRHQLKGLNLVPRACVIPHHDTFGKSWALNLAAMLPGTTLIGIDEQTGMINDGPEGQWSVYGKGAVTLYGDAEPKVFRPGEPFLAPFPSDREGDVDE
jgi:cyanophycinase